ncbi:hypothetical protein SCG7086_AA_00020 [Chlamydiales bacterium SCGC AG-110-P3]|nr:hypothetical protein SCG7086_AA_00020 [Chlamydiales bacterium SCGC AG-110-P3]
MVLGQRTPIAPIDLEAFEALGQSSIALFVLVFFLCFAVMFAIVWIGWWVTNRQGSVSPFTGHEMRRGEDLAYSAVQEVQKWLDSMADPDNPVLDIRRASVCRETGRIIPDSVNLFNVIKVDWGFLERRYPGRWVSWGSLSAVEKQKLKDCHESLDGFQVDESSSNPDPKAVDLYHMTLKPGPLYVDKASRVLMGWKVIPRTNLEVLVVQRPYRLPERLPTPAEKMVERDSISRRA